MTDPTFLNRILETVEDGQIVEVLIGRHWTAVVAEVRGVRRCGLASAVGGLHDHHADPNVPEAGHLHEQPARELAALARSNRTSLASVGLSTINALLPQKAEQWVTLNAEEVIASRGAGKAVALIGHFPFVPRLHLLVGELSVLEQYPRPGDLPASAAPAVLAEAAVVALTSMTIHNHTLLDLLRLCLPEALVILLGPSTPLSPVLFDYGVDILCGSVVTDIEPVLRVVGQGGNFRQMHRAGVRTVTMVRPGLEVG
jgi:uncharacterized protein (DUF4213/DUF364 family)